MAYTVIGSPQVGARERLMRLALVVPIAFAPLVCWIFIIMFCENR